MRKAFPGHKVLLVWDILLETLEQSRIFIAFFSLQIRVDSYHRGNSAITPLEAHDEFPLSLRIENVISINPDLVQDNASALNSWKVRASGKENPEHLCQAEITPFCVKGGESDDIPAQSKKRKRNES